MFKGIKIMSAKYPGFISLVTYHPPDSITWRWSISLSYINDGRKTWEIDGYRHEGNGGCWCRCPFFTVALAWQDTVKR